MSEVIKAKVTKAVARAFVRCSKCDRHLGQIIDDGLDPTSRKYCVNCGALDF